MIYRTAVSVTLGILGAFLSQQVMAKSHKHDVVPQIVKDEQSFDRCAEDETGPCFGRLLTIKNFGSKLAKVKVMCDNTNLVDTIKIKPHSTFKLDIGHGSGSLAAGQCHVVPQERK